MNITLEPKDAVIDHVRIDVSPADYQPEYEKSLKDYRKKVQLPGFRPGTVPASLIRKRFGSSLLAEQINQLVSKSLSDYLEQEQLTFLGRPYLADTNFKDLEPEANQDLQFTFELGKAPEFELNLEGIPAFDDFTVTVPDADLEKQVQRYQVQMAHNHEADLVEIGKEYQLQGILNTEPRTKLATSESDPVEAEYDYRKAFTVYTALIPALKPLLQGKKIGDSITFVPAQIFPDDVEGAMQLRVDLSHYKEIKDKTFFYDIRGLFLNPVHPLNPEFYSHIFQGEEIPTEEMFRERLREKMQADAEEMNKAYLENRIRRALLKNHPFELPDKVLQAWFYEEVEEARKGNNFASMYAQYREDMRLHLIRQKLEGKYPALILGEDEVKGVIKERLKGMFQMPPAAPKAELEEGIDAQVDGTTEAAELPEGMEGPENPMIDTLVEQVMGNQQFYQREYQTLQTQRFMEVLRKEVVQIVPKQATFGEFERHVATSGE